MAKKTRKSTASEAEAPTGEAETTEAGQAGQTGSGEAVNPDTTDAVDAGPETDETQPDQTDPDTQTAAGDDVEYATTHADEAEGSGPDGDTDETSSSTADDPLDADAASDTDATLEPDPPAGAAPSEDLAEESGTPDGDDETPRDTQSPETDDLADGSAGDVLPGEYAAQSGDETDMRATDTRASDDSVADTSPTTSPVASSGGTEKTIVERKGGFFPMLIGGVAAAAIGYGAADYSQPGGFLGPTTPAGPDPFEEEVRAALDAAQDRLASLEGQDPGLDESALEPLTGNLDALTTRLDGLGEDLNALREEFGGLAEVQSTLDTRLTELAQAPVEDNVSEEAIAAYEEAIAGYEAEMSALAESMAQQRAEIEGLAAEAADREAQARSEAQQARIQSAAASLIVQVESGEPFADALEAHREAGGAPVDPALSDLAVEGVPGLGELQAEFPDAARRALALVRAGEAETSDGAGGLGTFLARQLGARSVVPRDGDDPDAVLSRAEAAVRSGNLDAALREIESLPEVARSALAEWEATARTRRDAVAAATALTASANSN